MQRRLDEPIIKFSDDISCRELFARQIKSMGLSMGGLCCDPASMECNSLAAIGNLSLADGFVIGERKRDACANPA